MSKKIISLLLCAVMVFGLGITAFAAEPTYKTITGEYSYCPSLGFLDPITNQTCPFTYSDEYFVNSGYDYNHNLAIMSMALTQASFASAVSSTVGWDKANSNFKDLVTKCGFTNVGSNYDAVHHPEGRTIGANAASKKIVVDGKTYTLIALGIRGHNYGGEWYSNFEVGATGDHVGFADARDKVLSFLKQYIADNKITGNIKLWTVGYSRGAITANMLAGALDQGYKLGKAKLDPNDLYCYTFETPQGVYDSNTHAAVYANIHNILNRNDFVPYASFAEWGHARYGVDYYVPCKQLDPEYSSLKPVFDKELSKLGWMNILGVNLDVVDQFHYLSLNPATAISKANVTQIEYYPEVVDALLDSMVPSREYYVQYLQSDLEEITKTLLGIDTSRLLNALVIFAQKFTNLDNLSELLSTLTISGMEANGTAVDVVIDLLMEAMNEAKCADYNGDQLRACLTSLVPKMLVLTKEHPDTVITLLGNVVQIINAHFSEIGNIWLRVTPAEFFEAQNTFSGNVNEAQISFKDVAKEAYYYDAVKWATDEGITKGYSADFFGPNDPCTRAQVVTFLWRAAGSPEPSGKCPFVDVPESGDYYKAITWAAEKKIALGVDAKHFAPDVVVSRGQFATFLWRFEGQPKVSGKCPFSDVSSSDFYYKAILWAAKNKIALGVDASHFAPNDACTRAQVVTFIFRDMT